MYQAIHSMDPAVMVLATGDGAGWQQDRWFVPALRAARSKGWGVEVAAWADSLNPELATCVRAAGGTCVSLDDYYFGVSGVHRLRSATPVSLRGRATADATVLTPMSAGAGFAMDRSAAAGASAATKVHLVAAVS